MENFFASQVNEIFEYRLRVSSNEKHALSLLIAYSRRGQRDEISFRPLAFRPLHHLDEHGGQRNQDASANNPNDISHESNGEKLWAGSLYDNGL